nr:ABC transporter permease [Actinomycetota bacterium]
MTFTEYLSQRWPDILPLVIEHAQIVLIAVAIGTVLGIGLGIIVEGHTAATNFALALTGAMLTIPSFALFGLLIPLLGLGATPTITAL